MSVHHIVLSWHDWIDLFAHYLMLSLMSLGGAISTSSEMHRYLVEQQGWLTQAQFNEAIALAQAAPGPNVLFVALMGWHVGLNAGSGSLGVGRSGRLTGAGPSRARRSSGRSAASRDRFAA